MDIANLHNPLTKENSKYFQVEKVMNRFKDLGVDRFTSSVAKRYLIYCANNELNLSESKQLFITNELSHVSRLNNYSSALNKVLRFTSEADIQYVINVEQIEIFFNLKHFLENIVNPKTIKSYINAFNQYHKFIENNLNKSSEPKKELKDVFNYCNVEQFKLHLLKEGKSPYTVNQYLAILKAYAKHEILNFQELEEQLHLTENEANRFRVQLDNIMSIKAIKIDKTDVDKCSGTLYLIKNTHNGLYKIGYTKKDYKLRFRTLFTQCGGGLETVLLGFTEEGYDKPANELEHDLHSIFTDKNITGEWFNLSELDVCNIFNYMGDNCNYNFLCREHDRDYLYNNYEYVKPRKIGKK